MDWLKRLRADKRSDIPGLLRQGEGYFYVSQLHIQAGGIPTHEFLHFDQKGKVCGIEIKFSPGSVDQVVERFDTIPNDRLLKGKYEIQGPNLVFRLVSSEVEVDYKGQIIGDRLSLHMHSRKNNYQSYESYSFVATRQRHLENIVRNSNPKPENSHNKSGPNAMSTQLAEKAWEYDRKSDTVNAIRNFDQAIQVAPLEHNLYYGRGVVYCKTQNYTMSIADLNRAIALVPEFPAALTERGLAFLESGNFDQALVDYERAIQFDSTYAQAYINIGSLYAKQGKWKQALEALSEGIRLKPAGDEVAYINRSTTYEQLGDIAAAIRDVEKYLQTYPQGPYVEYAQKRIMTLKDRAT